MAFMIPEYTDVDFAEVVVDPDYTEEHHWVPLPDVGPDDTVEQIVRGKWWARLSAPGYMDATDWTGPFDTEGEAKQFIRDTYEVDAVTGEDLEDIEARAFAPKHKKRRSMSRRKSPTSRLANPRRSVHTKHLSRASALSPATIKVGDIVEYTDRGNDFTAEIKVTKVTKFGSSTSGAGTTWSWRVEGVRTRTVRTGGRVTGLTDGAKVELYAVSAAEDGKPWVWAYDYTYFPLDDVRLKRRKRRSMSRRKSPTAKAVIAKFLRGL